MCLFKMLWSEISGHALFLRNIDHSVSQAKPYNEAKIKLQALRFHSRDSRLRRLQVQEVQDRQVLIPNAEGEHLPGRHKRELHLARGESDLATSQKLPRLRQGTDHPWVSSR